MLSIPRIVSNSQASRFFMKSVFEYECPGKKVTVYLFVAGMTCDDDQFECKLIFQCIPLTKFKDHVYDCIDRTDETDFGNTALFKHLSLLFIIFIQCCSHVVILSRVHVYL